MKFFLTLLNVALLIFSTVGAGFAETLEEAWETGLKADHLLKAAGENTISRQAELDAAKGGRFPTLNVGAGYFILDNEPVSMAGDVQFATADNQSLSYQTMVTRNRYKEGIGTNTEVLDAESLRTVNYVSYDKANNDAVLAVLRLHYAIGNL